MLLLRLHQLQNQMVNGGVFFVVLPVRQGAAAENLHPVLGVLRKKRAFPAAEEEVRVALSNLRRKQLLQKADALLPAVQPAARRPEPPPGRGVLRRVKQRRAPHRLSPEFFQRVAGIRDRVAHGVRTNIQAEIIVVSVFHIDIPLHTVYNSAG